MKNKKEKKGSDKRFTDVVRQAERLLLCGENYGWRYDLLTKPQYAAVYKLQRAANVCAVDALLNSKKKMPFSFVYRGHRYGLAYSNLGRVFISFSPGSESFCSSSFFMLWDAKK